MPLTFNAQEFFPSEDLRKTWRDDLGLADDDLLVVTAGKFTAYKELERLLSAFKSAGRDLPRLKLALAGADDSGYAKELRRRVAEDPFLADRTSFVGFLDSAGLNGFLNAGDIGVWPKLPAVTIQQAMGTGLFVVLPRNDWVGHLVKDDSLGLYFDSDATDAMAEALRSAAARLEGDREDRERRGRANLWLSAEGVAAQLLETLVPARSPRNERALTNG